PASSLFWSQSVSSLPSPPSSGGIGPAAKVQAWIQREKNITLPASLFSIYLISVDCVPPTALASSSKSRGGINISYFDVALDLYDPLARRPHPAGAREPRSAAIPQPSSQRAKR
ncbi:unnamed protein product, partial [Ectocarpus sp. 12 AP-2014]